MMIAIDIGNTNTGIALLDCRERSRPVRKVEYVKTGFQGCFEKRMIKALRAMDYESTALDSVVVCSVSPKALTIVKRCVKKVFNVSPKVVGKDIIVPIKNRYEDPRQVGQDRLVCAYAAMELYGAPAVVVDLGTAITFDVVSKRKEYLGGMIVPGLRLSAEALYNKTALLPQIDIHKPKRLIGKTTEESILSGLFYGYGEMIKGVIDLLVKQSHEEPKIVVTGGYSDLMRHYVPQYKCIVERDLIFKGISLLVKCQS